MANKLFKCTEKKGFYSVQETVSEQDIIAFAQDKIDRNNFELQEAARGVKRMDALNKSYPHALNVVPQSAHQKTQQTTYKQKLVTMNMKGVFNK